MQKIEEIEGKRFSLKENRNFDIDSKNMAKIKDGRPRSRSVYTAHSNIMKDELNSRDLEFVEGSSSMPNTSWVNRAIMKTYYLDDFYTDYNDSWRSEHEIADTGYAGAVVTTHGVITLKLRDRVRIDLSLDKALRIVNLKNNIIMALSSTGASAALLHPNGRVYQYGSRVEILAYDSHGNNNKYAKMWYKGVSFTSDQCALVYLVDSAGTRTTTDNFSDLNYDFSHQVFYNESRHGGNYVQDAIQVLNAANHWTGDDGTTNWIINNVRIMQTSDGLVRVGRNSNKFSLRTSPSNGSASVSSPFMHCTGSMGQTRHLFVRRGERRMHYDGTSFIVRNAGHSAGFDDKHQLKVY